MKKVTESTISGIMSKLTPDETKRITEFATRLHMRECKEIRCNWWNENFKFKDSVWILGPEHRSWFWKAWDFCKVNKSESSWDIMLQLLDVCAGRV